MGEALRRGRRLASRLPLPEPWRVEDFCALMAAERHRPISLIERAGAGDSITAMVVSTEVADYIFCRDDIRGIHRDHAICHELGHLLARHDRSQTLDPRFLATPAAAGSLSTRHPRHRSEECEREAEAIADEIMRRISQRLARERDQQEQRIIIGFREALG
jgi:hypothetical protein